MLHFSRALRLIAWPLAISAQLASGQFAQGASGEESPAKIRALSAGPAVHDFFASALKVSAQPVWIHNTGNQLASMEQSEALLAHGGEANAAASLWYTWTVRERTELLVDTAGSAFSTAIGVYSGTSLGSLVPVAGASSTVQARDAWVRFMAEPNISYKIAIAGIPPTPLGNLRVRFEEEGEPDLALPVLEVTRPTSGTTVREGRVRIEGTAFDPQPNGSGVREVQYTLSIEGDAIIRNAQGTANFNATVDLAEGANVVTLWANDRADNRSSERRVTIMFSPVVSTNDLFHDRIVLDMQTIARTDLSSGATREFLEPAHAGNLGGSSIWYEFSAAESGVLLLSTLGSSFDTLLGVYVSTNAGLPTVTNLIELANNDDVMGGGGYSEAAVTIQPERSYFIAVDGFDGQSGVVQLNYRFSPVRVYELTVRPSLGNGTVSPGSGAYPQNATVSILAQPEAGYEFDYFETPSGPARANPLALVMNQDLAVRAVFRVRTYAEDFEGGLNFPFEGVWTLQTDPTNRFNQVFMSLGNRAGRGTNIVSLTVQVANGIGGFDFGVSTETNHDRLEFSVVYLEDDGGQSSPILLGAWSGEARGRHEFALRSGLARLEWRFIKDAAISDGADSVFIDNLDLPFSVVEFEVVRSGQTVTVQLSGLGGQSMRVESSTDLRNWSSARIATPDSSGQAAFQESVSGQARFYRFLVIPPQPSSPP